METVTKAVIRQGSVFYAGFIGRPSLRIRKCIARVVGFVRNHGVKPAPLVPLPVIPEPFSRVAMDMVGPIPRSQAGNRYILVVPRSHSTESHRRGTYRGRTLC